MHLPIIQKYFQAFVWTVVLTCLFFLDASSDYSFCLFRLVGIDSCPGCGIGHAIHYVLHLDLEKSMEANFMGIPATAAILFTIIKPFLPSQKTSLQS
jgi:hypothetical protein